jgi:hypothetical protein
MVDWYLILTPLLILPIVALFAFVGCIDWESLGYSANATLQLQFNTTSFPMQKVAFIIVRDGMVHNNVEVLIANTSPMLDTVGFPTSAMMTDTSDLQFGLFQLAITDAVLVSTQQWHVMCDGYTLASDPQPLYPASATANSQSIQTAKMPPQYTFKFQVIKNPNPGPPYHVIAPA